MSETRVLYIDPKIDPTKRKHVVQSFEFDVWTRAKELKSFYTKSALIFGYLITKLERLLKIERYYYGHWLDTELKVFRTGAVSVCGSSIAAFREVAAKNGECEVLFIKKISKLEYELLRAQNRHIDKLAAERKQHEPYTSKE